MEKPTKEADFRTDGLLRLQYRVSSEKIDVRMYKMTFVIII